MGAEMAYAAAAQGGLNVFGGALNAYGQAKANRAAGKVIGQAETANTANTAAENKLQQPIADTGLQAFQMGANKALQGTDYTNQPKFQQQNFGGVNMNEDPGMAFRMQQGQKALDQSAANAGNLHSGAQQKALLAYGQNQGSQEFGNAYNRQYGQFKDTQNMAQQQHNIENQAATDIERYKMGDLQNYGNAGINATNAQNQNLQSGNAQQMQLMGAQADNAAKQAGGTWSAVGNSLSGAGNAGANTYSAYMMGQK